MRYLTLSLASIFIVLLPVLGGFLLILYGAFDGGNITNLVTIFFGTLAGALAGAYFVNHAEKEKQQKLVLNDLNSLSSELILLERKLELLDSDFIIPLENEINKLNESYAQYIEDKLSEEVVANLLLQVRHDEKWGASFSAMGMAKYAYKNYNLYYQVLLLLKEAQSLDALIVTRNEIISAYKKDDLVPEAEILIALQGPDQELVNFLTSCGLAAYQSQGHGILSETIVSKLLLSIDRKSRVGLVFKMNKFLDGKRTRCVSRAEIRLNKFFYLLGKEVLDGIGDDNYIDNVKAVSRTVKNMQQLLKDIKPQVKSLGEDLLEKRYHTDVVNWDNVLVRVR